MNQALTFIRKVAKQSSLLFEHTNDMIWLLDAEGRFVWFNKPSEEISGYKVEDWEGKSFAPLVVPEDLPMAQRIFVETLSGTPQTYEVGVLARDGHTFYLAVKTAPIMKGGKVIGTISFGQDITAMRKMQARLTILWNVSLAITSTLHPDKVLWEIYTQIKRTMAVSTFFIALYDEHQEELSFEFRIDDGVLQEKFKRPMRWGEGLSEWIIQTKKPLLIRDMERERNGLPVKGILHGRETRSLLGVPLLVEGRVIGVMMTQDYEPEAFDEDDQLFLSMIASSASTAIENARLYHQLEEAYEQLKKTQDHLIHSERLRALGEMAAGIAHNFNNLLVGILGGAEMIRMQSDDPAVVSQDVATVISATKRAADVVRRVMMFTSTSWEYQTRSINVNAMVEEAILMSQKKWKDMWQNMTVVSEPGEIVPVSGVTSEIVELLMILIDNAIEAMPEGGTLTVTTRRYPAPEDRATRRQGDKATGVVSGSPPLPISPPVGTEREEREWVEIMVTDTGVGMTEEIQQRCFEPFFTTKGPQIGRGLGLSVAYGIATRHRGEIAIESTPDHGTTLTVRLPASQKVEEYPVKM